MILTVITAVLSGVLNAFIVKLIVLHSLTGSNKNFLYSWGLALVYKIAFLAVCFLVFYKFNLPHIVIFFITLISVQTLGQIILIKRKNETG